MSPDKQGISSALLHRDAGRRSTEISTLQLYGDVPLLYSPDAGAARRTFELFAVNIRNPNTRKAYARAALDFAAWCALYGIGDVRQVQPVHVAAYLESLKIAAPSVKQRLAALRMLFN